MSVSRHRRYSPIQKKGGEKKVGVVLFKKGQGVEPCTCPVAGRTVRIWEEVVLLERPGRVIGIFGRGIYSRRGVKRVHSTVQVGVMDQFVQVAEPATSASTLQHALPNSPCPSTFFLQH